MTPVWAFMELNLILHDNEQLFIYKQIIASLSGATGVQSRLLVTLKYLRVESSLAEK